MIKLLLGLLFVSGSANAAEDLYPCNLELKRPAVASTDPGTFYARAYVEDRLADPTSPMKYRWMNLVAPKTGSWVSLFNSNEEFRYRIQTLQFPQSLESLGVSYRVGFCYLGPISTATQGNGDDTSKGSYALVGTVSTGTAADYIPYSGLVTGKCDLRGAGANKSARLATEVAPGMIDNDMSFSISLGQLASGEIGFDYPINGQMTQVPRFCRMTVEINEESQDIRPSEVNLNQAQFILQIDKNLL